MLAKAKNTFEELIKENDIDIMAYYNLAKVEELLDKKDRASDLYNKIYNWTHQMLM